MSKESQVKALRKDVDLDGGTIKFLTIGALAQKRKLKNYMEQVLIDKATEIKNTESEKVGGKK